MLFVVRMVVRKRVHLTVTNYACQLQYKLCVGNYMLLLGRSRRYTDHDHGKMHVVAALILINLTVAVEEN